MDQNFLLTAEKLTLNPELQRGWVAHGALAIKNVPAQTYLRVSSEQANVLEVFANGNTVPTALGILLKDRLCLPMREFFELVVKAHQVGILCSGQERRPVRQPVRWPGLNATLAFWPALGMALAAFAGLVFRATSMPAGWVPIATGLVAGWAAHILGRCLAASILVHAGGEVYRCKARGLMRMRGPFDLKDRLLLRPMERALIALGGNLPLTLCLLVALGQFPQHVLPLAAVWLAAWRPWGSGLPRRLAGLFSRYPCLDTDGEFQFLPNQRPQLHWRVWSRRWDWRVGLMELAGAVAWALVVSWVLLGSLGLSFREAAGDWSYWSMSLPLLVSALLLTIVVVMVRRWRDGFRRVWRSARRWIATLKRRWWTEFVFPDNEAALLRMAAAHPLLGQLGPYDQAAIVRAWRPATFKAWNRLSGGEEDSVAVGLIMSGTAEAYRAEKNGRRARVLPLAEGDFFGLPQLGAGMETLRAVKSRTPVSALMLPMEAFRSLVVARLEANVVHDLTHKYTFLQRLPICAHWHAHAVSRFARISQISEYSDGEYILNEQEDPRWFYIVYDGIAQVRRRGKLATRLKVGEFFGEISLLQNSAAVADVVAQGLVRCLQIDRESFLKFITHNHHVAIQLEKISSARLGRPIFPMQPAL